MKSKKKDYVFSDAEVAAVLNQLHEKSKSQSPTDGRCGVVAAVDSLEGASSPAIPSIKDSVAAGLATPVQGSPLDPMLKVPEPKPSLPGWWKFTQRRELKKSLVQKHSDEYAKPVRLADKTMYSPSEQEIKEYTRLLKNASLKDLQDIDKFRQIPLKLDVIDRLKSVDKKKHAVITIFNDNNTTDTGVTHINSRHFSRSNCLYLVIKGSGYYDPEFRMVHFYYRFNDPWPLGVDKGQLTKGQPDGKLLDDVIEFKLASALANIDMAGKIDMIFIMSIIGRILEAAILLVCLRGFKII